MTEKNITKHIAEHIAEQKIPINQIAQDTDISIHKLKVTTKEKLTAVELLTLCRYLNIKPEEFK